LANQNRILENVTEYLEPAEHKILINTLGAKPNDLLKDFCLLKQVLTIEKSTDKTPANAKKKVTKPTKNPANTPEETKPLAAKGTPNCMHPEVEEFLDS
jgi:hypothetical protein